MILDPLLDFFRGQAVTIPPMDGALRPNVALDEADILKSCEEPDNIVSVAGKLIYSSDREIFATNSGKAIASFDSTITAIAANSSGTIAVGLNTGGIVLHKSKIPPLDGFNCPTALAFDGANDLYICNGSDTHSASEWAVDLMQKNFSGSLWHVSLKSGERRCLAKKLAFPYGLVVDATNNRVIVSEAWRHRLVSIPVQGGMQKPVLAKLAGYPARITRKTFGGFILCLFAPRNRLIEFVLQEDDYRNAMLDEIDSRYWIAPSLSASRSFLEPLQNGGVKTMGIHKPWSPSRSYGLIVELDNNLLPVTSYHSRANGTRHGITSAIEHDGKIIATSRGGNLILRVTPETGQV
jgi:DNA-binding beta-propeller fold protein YncE